MSRDHCRIRISSIKARPFGPRSAPVPYAVREPLQAVTNVAAGVSRTRPRKRVRVRNPSASHTSTRTAPGTAPTPPARAHTNASGGRGSAPNPDALGSSHGAHPTRTKGRQTVPPRSRSFG